MMYTDETIVLREICNGMMAVSAVILISVFAVYVIRYSRAARGWYNDIGVQAAIAVIILMVGHLIRAFSSWMEFLWLDLGWPQGFWVNAVGVFVAATIFTVAGKVLCAFAFAPYRWRWHLTVFIAVVSIAIPLIVAALVPR